jgi:thiamine pyrophosphokinase
LDTSIGMNRVIVQSHDGITLVGGGPVGRAALTAALSRAPRLVAVDGGVDRVRRAGLLPEAVIGDMDSASKAGLAAMDPARIHRIDEQETTDFDKALRSVAAPFVLALGFAGARLDHGLAVLNTIVQQDKTMPCLVVGARDVVFHAPRDLTLTLRRGDRVSLFPMTTVTGRSEGLEWPIDGLTFHPAGRIGTSNRVSGAVVRLCFDGPGMLVMLSVARLDVALSGLLRG